MDHLEHLDCVASLVALKVADEMPMDVARQLRNFRLRFLDTVLAETSQPGVIRSADHFGREGFRDGKQENVLRLATCSFRGSGNASLYALYVLSETGHAWIKTDRSGWRQCAVRRSRLILAMNRSSLRT